MVSQEWIDITSLITSDCYATMNANSKEGHEPECALRRQTFEDFHGAVTNCILREIPRIEFPHQQLEAIIACGAVRTATCTRRGHHRQARSYLAGAQPVTGALSPVDGGDRSGDKEREKGLRGANKMRSEGRLSPQRPQRLRTPRRVLPKLLLGRSKRARAATESRQPQEEKRSLPRLVSL